MNLRRTHAGPALAVLTVLSASAFAAGAPGPVPWSAYQAAAAAWTAASAGGTARVPADSPLLANAVRWPDGTVQAVDPVPLKAGLAAPAGTPAGAAARAGLALVTAAPARPADPRVSPAELRAGLHSLLRDPAFASSRVGWRQRAAASLGALLERGLGRLWRLAMAAVRLWSLPGGRLAATAAGVATLAAAGLAAALLVRSGLERSRRPTERAAVPRPTDLLREAQRLLAAGDVRGATSLAYREAVSAVTRRTGTRIRRGWTAADIRRAAGMDASWPAFAELAAFHARVLFGPVPVEDGRAAEAARWLEEVRRWSGAAPGRASGPRSWRSAR